MSSRLLVTLLGIPAVYFFLTAGDFWRFAFILAATWIAQFELHKMFSDPSAPLPYMEFTLATIILGASSKWAERGLAFSAGLSIIMLGSLIVLTGFNGTGLKRFSLGLMNLLYIPFSLSFFLMLGHLRGGEVVFAVLLAVWALDSGAYFVGRAFRGPFIAPKISPSKTISGSIGGFLATLLSVLCLSKTNFFPFSLATTLGLGISIGIFGQISDLFESVLKREAGIKDSSSLLGAHGGMLDRIDSLIFVAPISYFFLSC
ncbi:MAG: phosphatidate cytidylyltransferase [Candidatus Riflebacteria bacterium]|nr:phosphatidate cytidylyltransferase [Candidatus Riflebacteria bacterium]